MKPHRFVSAEVLTLWRLVSTRPNTKTFRAISKPETNLASMNGESRCTTDITIIVIYSTATPQELVLVDTFSDKVKFPKLRVLIEFLIG